MTAYINPDGRIVIVMLNRTKEAIPVVIRMEGQIVSLAVSGRSICTGEIER